MTKAREALLWLGVVLLVGAAMRLPHIGQPLVDTFSWREASTAMMADNFRPGAWNILYPQVSWVGPGPGYQGREFQLLAYITALLNHGFGWHDWFGRAVAASFGLLGVAAFFFIARNVAGPGQGLAAALALALLPGAAFVDRSFLPDPAMLGLTLCGFLLLIVYLKTRRLFLLYAAAIVLALGVLAKLPGVAILGAVAYALFEAGRQRPWTRRELLHLGAAALIFAAPVCAYYAWAVYLGTHTPPFHVAGAGYVFDHPLGFVRERFYLGELKIHMTDWFAGPAILVLAAAGLFVRPPTEDSDAAAFRLPWLFEVWLISSGLLFLVAAREFANNPWNLVFFAPPLAGLAGRAIAALIGAPPRLLGGGIELRPLLALFAVVAVLFVAGQNDLATLRTPYAANDREMGMRLAALSAPDELVVTAAQEIGNPIAIYYSRRRGWVFPPGGLCPPGGGVPDSNWSRLESDTDSIFRLDTLRAEGADWFGLNKHAIDSAGVRLVETHARFLAHLDAVSSYTEDHPHFRIYRLRALHAPPRPPLPCPHAPG